MHDDDPADVVARRVRRGAVRRRPARPADRSAPSTSIEALTRDADRRLLPARTTGPRTWSSRSPATSTTPTSCAGAQGVRAAAGSRREPAPRRSRRAPAGAARRRRRRRALVTGATEQANVVLGGAGPGPHRRAPLRARRAQRGARRRHDLAGCSRRSARSAAWPTRSTPSPRSTPTPACSASTPAACPSKVDEVLALCRGELAQVAARRHHRPRSCAAARASCAAALVLGLEDTGSRMTPDRQGRAGLRRAAVGRRDARAGSTPSRSTTCARSPPSCSAAPPTLAVDRPVRRRTATFTARAGRDERLRSPCSAPRGRMGSQVVRGRRGRRRPRAGGAPIDVGDDLGGRSPRPAPRSPSTSPRPTR